MGQIGPGFVLVAFASVRLFLSSLWSSLRCASSLSSSSFVRRCRCVVERDASRDAAVAPRAPGALHAQLGQAWLSLGQTWTISANSRWSWGRTLRPSHVEPQMLDTSHTRPELAPDSKPHRSVEVARELPGKVVRSFAPKWALVALPLRMAEMGSRANGVWRNHALLGCPLIVRPMLGRKAPENTERGRMGPMFSLVRPSLAVSGPTSDELAPNSVHIGEFGRLRSEFDASRLEFERYCVP